MRKHAWLQTDASIRTAASIIFYVCALRAAEASQNANRSDFAIPDYDIYHKREKAFWAVEQIASRNPAIFRVDEMNVQDGDYASTLKVVTVEPSGLSNDHLHKIRLLLDFGEHGRELVTVEVALRLLELLGDPSAIETLVLSRGGNPLRLLSLLERCVFKIVPMENAHGREIVEGGNLCERKNGRGVDSNRNWPVHWGFREKDYDPNEEYPGTKPFSEPEVQILNGLAEEFQPHVWMNMHSGMEALFMPYDHLAALPADGPGRASLRLLQQLNALKCGGRCAVGSGGKSVGYLAHGTATDYMHDVLGVPFSFTWEIFGDMEAHFNDCFRMFNPTSKEHLDEVVTNWADAVLAMVELMPSSEPPAGNIHFLSRKFFQGPRQDGQIYNTTETDTAASVRQARLASAFAVVTEVDRELGLAPGTEAWELLDVPFFAWVLVLCSAVLALGLLLGRAALRDMSVRLRSRTWRRRHVAVL